MEARTTLRSMLAMPFIRRVSVTLLIDIEVSTISLATRNRLDSLLVVTIYRDQVLRFHETSATAYPCGINDERIFTLGSRIHGSSLILAPNTGVVYVRVLQLRVPLIHQVLTTDLLTEEQRICSIHILTGVLT